MIYYKDINGNIYTGDKADYKDVQLSQGELDVHLADVQTKVEREAIKKNIEKIKLKTVEHMMKLLNPDVAQNKKDNALDRLKELQIELDTEQAKLD